MRFILEYDDLSKYLEETNHLNFGDRLVLSKSQELFKDIEEETEKIAVAFHFVRDEIDHSWDIQSTRVTRSASEVLKYKEGICYAKSMLLAALLRSQNIPTGFCYQRLTLGDTPETGYCIHALNAVYIGYLDRWIRIDARGNTNGIDAQFSLEEEKLAFPIRSEYDEVDYGTIYANPLDMTVKTLEENDNCIEMVKYMLPERL